MKKLIIILLSAITLFSCATKKAGCDAYAKNQNKLHNTKMVKK
jgi:PBP1b-binding outer membrane lipoprotein LpoB